MNLVDFLMMYKISYNWILQQTKNSDRDTAWMLPWHYANTTLLRKCYEYVSKKVLKIAMSKKKKNSKKEEMIRLHSESYIYKYIIYMYIYNIYIYIYIFEKY